MKIGFIGSGNMAEAIMKGIISAKLYSADSIIASDIRSERLDFLKNDLSINITTDNKKLLSKSDIVIFAVKPQNIKDLLDSIKEDLTEKHLCISILAGVKTSFFEQAVEDVKLRVIRVMPNTPALIQCGASALSKGTFASQEDLNTAKAIFDSVGKSVIVDEKLQDAVTGLSGSGPAYIFLIAETLIKAGMELGLDQDVANLLTKQMIFGAAKLLVESDKSPEELRKAVTSPGGTTQAAIEYMFNNSLPEVLANAVKRAAERSAELGNK